jgi:ribulose 1,5-bisphosphate synthetase/thiazole synthase
MHAGSLPVVIIGAGPVGLAAAAHVLSRNLTPLVFEAGEAVGAGIRRWGHVRMFSPWKFNVDSAAVDLLARHGWTLPDEDEYSPKQNPTLASSGQSDGRQLASCSAARAMINWKSVASSGRESASCSMRVGSSR